MQVDYFPSRNNDVRDGKVRGPVIQQSPVRPCGSQPHEMQSSLLQLLRVLRLASGEQGAI